MRQGWRVATRIWPSRREPGLSTQALPDCDRGADADRAAEIAHARAHLRSAQRRQLHGGKRIALDQRKSLANPVDVYRPFGVGPAAQQSGKSPPALTQRFCTAELQQLAAKHRKIASRDEPFVVATDQPLLL